MMPTPWSGFVPSRPPRSASGSRLPSTMGRSGRMNSKASLIRCWPRPPCASATCRLVSWTARSAPRAGTSGRRVGRWRSTVSRLASPLTGSDEWLRYEGITLVTPLWRGAYAVELDTWGGAGRLRAFDLRLYGETVDQWLLPTGVVAEDVRP